MQNCTNLVVARSDVAKSLLLSNPDDPESSVGFCSWGACVTNTGTLHPVGACTTIPGPFVTQIWNKTVHS